MMAGGAMRYQVPHQPSDLQMAIVSTLAKVLLECYFRLTTWYELAQAQGWCCEMWRANWSAVQSWNATYSSVSCAATVTCDVAVHQDDASDRTETFWLLENLA